MGDRPIRPASRPSRPRTKKTAPSSISSSAVCSTADQPRFRILTALSSPSLVPTTTSRSPAVRMKSGIGLGCASPARITATTETPVRVRSAVSPSGRPSNGVPSLTGSCRVCRPGHVALLLVEVGHQLRGAEQVGQRAGLVVAQRQLGHAGVRVVGLGDDQLELAVAVADHADPAAVPQREVLAHTDPGQRGHLDIHPIHGRRPRPVRRPAPDGRRRTRGQPVTRAGAAVVPAERYIVLASRGSCAVDRLRRTP